VRQDFRTLEEKIKTNFGAKLGKCDCVLSVWRLCCGGQILERGVEMEDESVVTMVDVVKQQEEEQQNGNS